MRRVLAALLAPLLLTGCGPRAADTAASPEDSKVAVELGLPHYEAVERTVDVVGTLYGEEETTISAKVPGRVVAVYKDLGDMAKAGEALAQVDKTDYDLMLRQRDLAMRQTLIKLGVTEIPGSDFKAAEVVSVKRAALQVESAKSRYDRNKQLRDEGTQAVTDQEFSDLLTAWEVAQSNLQAEIIAAQALAGEARMEQAQMEMARQSLVDTAIRAPGGPGMPTTAPATGAAPAASRPATRPTRYRVVGKLVNLGEYVKEGTPTFKLVDDSTIKLRAWVPERYVGRVALGQEVRVRVGAEREHDRAFIGRISRINPQVDPVYRTFQVEAVVPNDEDLLRSGQFANASIVTHTDAKVLFVPQKAVVSFAGEHRVFRVGADGKAVEVRVELGEAEHGEFLEVATDIGDGPVVTAGTTKLANGVDVTVVRAADPATRPASSPAGAADAGGTP